MFSEKMSAYDQYLKKKSNLKACTYLGDTLYRWQSAKLKKMVIF